MKKSGRRKVISLVFALAAFMLGCGMTHSFDRMTLHTKVGECVQMLSECTSDLKDCAEARSSADKAEPEGSPLKLPHPGPGAMLDLPGCPYTTYSAHDVSGDMPAECVRGNYMAPLGFDPVLEEMVRG